MNKPSSDISNMIINAIRIAWKDVPMPIILMRYSNPMESKNIEEYFFDRSISCVNLNDKRICNELIPFHYMTKEAILYYLQAYLIYLVDIDSHKDNSGCGNMVAINAITILCDKNYVEHPKYTREQLNAIVDVLKFIENNIEYYYMDSDDQLQILFDGINRWTVELEAS